MAMIFLNTQSQLIKKMLVLLVIFYALSPAFMFLIPYQVKGSTAIVKTLSLINIAGTLLMTILYLTLSSCLAINKPNKLLFRPCWLFQAQELSIRLACFTVPFLKRS